MIQEQEEIWLQADIDERKREYQEQRTSKEERRVLRQDFRGRFTVSETSNRADIVRAPAGRN